MKNKLSLFAIAGLSLMAVPSLAQTVALKTSVETNLSAKCDSFVEKRLNAVTHAKSKAAITGWSSVILHIDGELTPEREKTLTALGADIYRRLPIISSAAVRVPTRNLKELAALEFVTRLSADVTVEKQDEFTVQHTGADLAYNDYYLSGYGITVAVVDSGINTHRDLNTDIYRGAASRILASVNFSSASGTADACGHGTHIAGIIAGNGASSTGSNFTRTFYGIARNASLVNVRVLDGTGSGSVSSVISGLNWVIQNKDAYNIRVINLSLGHPVGESYKTDPLCQAVEAAYRAGIVVVCAAGNNGRLYADPSLSKTKANEGWGTNYGSIQSPGNDPYIITVGAIKPDANNSNDKSKDQIATYSSRGPSRIDFVMKPDIVAPGNRVISLNWSHSALDSVVASNNVVPLNYYVKNGTTAASRQYLQMSGTSMSAPVVTGAVALMLEEDWWFTGGTIANPDTIKARLMATADKLPGKMDPCTYGAGFLNIMAALDSNIIAPMPAITPSLAISSNGDVVIRGDQLLWTPTAGIWGAPELTSLQSIWGSSIKDINGVQSNQLLWTGKLTDTKDLTQSTVWSDQMIWQPGDGKTTVDLSSVVLSGEW